MNDSSTHRSAPRLSRTAAIMLAAAVAVALPLAGQTAQAVTYYWDTNGTTGNFGNTAGTWGTSTFWNTNSAGTPAPTVINTTTADDLNFGTTVATATTINTTGTTQGFLGITFGSGQGGTTIATGGTLNMAATSTITNSTSGTALHQINAILAGSSNLTLAAGTGIIQFGGANTYTGATQINTGRVVANNASALGTTDGATTVASGATLDVRANIGTEAITINGTGSSGQIGALQIGLVNGGTGTVGGTVTLGSNSTIGAGTSTNASTLVINGAIGDGGSNYSLTIGSSNTGRVTLAGANTYGGATVINAGTLQISASNNLGNASATNTITLGGGTLRSTANTYDLGSNRAVSVTANSVVTVDADTLTISGAINYSAGRILKAGAGTLILPNANTGSGLSTGVGSATYTESFRADAGTVTIGNASAFGTGVFEYRGGTLTASTPLALSNGFVLVSWGTIGGSNSLTLGGAFNLSSGTNNPNNFGTLFITNTGATTLTGTVSLTDVATTDSQTLTVDVASGAGATEISGMIQNSSAGGASVGSLIKASAGTLTLSGSNNYAGTTNINAGTLVASNATALGTTTGGTTVASGAVLDVRAAIGAEALSLAGTGISSGGALITSTGTGSYGGAVTLAANSSIGGAGALTVSGAIGGAFNLTKAGSGITTLSAANTYTGGTTISAGTLRANGARTAASPTATPTSSSTGTAAVDVNTGGVLAGTGGTGDVNVNGGTITAGSGATQTDTVVALTTGNQTWSSGEGGQYTAKFTNSAQSGVGIGAGSTWDNLSMGMLTLVGGTQGFTIKVTTGALTIGGATQTFTPGTAANYQIASTEGISVTNASSTVGAHPGVVAGSLVSQTDLTSLFVLNTNDLSLDPGHFSIRSGSDGTDLFLTYDGGTNAAPEPTAAALFGLSGITLLGLRKRQSRGPVEPGVGDRSDAA
ncbi:MAG: autotransporter-associated beta strand repeat-containing protein [Tepidisphaeraceae bacterium]